MPRSPASRSAVAARGGRARPRTRRQEGPRAVLAAPLTEAGRRCGRGRRPGSCRDCARFRHRKPGGALAGQGPGRRSAQRHGPGPGRDRRHTPRGRRQGRRSGLPRLDEEVRLESHRPAPRTSSPAAPSPPSSTGTPRAHDSATQSSTAHRSTTPHPVAGSRGTARPTTSPEPIAGRPSRGPRRPHLRDRRLLDRPRVKARGSRGLPRCLTREQWRRRTSTSCAGFMMPRRAVTPRRCSPSTTPTSNWTALRSRSWAGVGVHRGHDGLRSFFREWHEAWETIDYDFDDPIDGPGEHVISFVTPRGRGRASGAEVETSLALVWTVRDGTIVRVVWFPSRGEALQAVGLRVDRHFSPCA